MFPGNVANIGISDRKKLLAFPPIVVAARTHCVDAMF